MSNRYVFSEPNSFDFDIDGHRGKFFKTNSPLTQHLIIEVDDRLRIAYKEQEAEYNYYILKGEGIFLLDDEEFVVRDGDLISIPPKTKFSYKGRMKMLLINTPHYSKEKEDRINIE